MTIGAATATEKQRRGCPDRCGWYPCAINGERKLPGALHAGLQLTAIRRHLAGASLSASPFFQHTVSFAVLAMNPAPHFPATNTLMMWLLLLPFLTQDPSERNMLVQEHARAENPTALLAGLKSSNARVQRLAVRAVGRLERSALQQEIEPLTIAADVDVRREAVNALAQMGASFAFASLLSAEKNGLVRAMIYESLGRSARAVFSDAELVLVTGLTDASVDARIGAARGLESLLRRNVRSAKPSTHTLRALQLALRENTSEPLRELALLALNTAGDHDSTTFAVALRDASPQVRRLAVIGTRQFIDDTSPSVRYEVMRVAATCGRLMNAVDDPSEMVTLAVADALGQRNCDARVIESMVLRGVSWRVRAHALVSLAKVAPDAARMHVHEAAASKIWQERAWAATAAKVLKDNETLALLAKDREPNVAIAAMTTPADALRGLSSTHAGLAFAAAELLKSTSSLASAEPQLLALLQRFSRGGRATVREPRVAALNRLGEIDGTRVVAALQPLLADVDPVVAALAAKIMSQKLGKTVQPTTTRYVPAPLQTDADITALRGATAVIRMKDVGTITVELLTDDAPVTVATFAQLSERGTFKGLTFHRIVANFVIQGGSPGADEYDGITPTFLRDEVGLVPHARGTLGISTRGRDTGDGQLFVNLVDNFRLDHEYTVFARVLDGMDVVDRVQEGDVIESIRIVRKTITAK